MSEPGLPDLAAGPVADSDADATPRYNPRLDYAPPLSVQKITLAIYRGQLDRREIEQDLGLPVQRIYRWETVSGEPSADEIYRLAKYLDVSLVYLCNSAIEVIEAPPPLEERGGPERPAQ